MIQARAAGEIVDGALAVNEICAGYWGRAFAAAEVTPNNVATKALTPKVMEKIGRQLVLRGEVVFEIEVIRGAVQLNSASSWNVLGDQNRYMYELSIASPSSVITRYRDMDAVLHLQYGSGIEQPWHADSPIGHDSSVNQSSNLARNAEKMLADEIGG